MPRRAASGGAGATAGGASCGGAAGAEAFGATPGAAQAGLQPAPPQTSLLQVSQVQTHFSPIFFEDFFGDLTHLLVAQLLMPSAARRPDNSPPDPHPLPQPAPHRPAGVQAPPAAHLPSAPQLFPQTPSQGLDSHGKRVGGMQIVFVSML
tara:strand:- start:7179 stop:7628 length:450 start_codon:yes stop_codon:yes gene_type:complete